MERKIFENPYSPTSQPPENLPIPYRCPLFSFENQPQSPLITNLHQSSDQTIESAFSRLTLSADPRFHAQTPSFHGPSTPNPVAPAERSAMAFGEPQQQALFWAQNINGVANGPYGYFGAHQKINVGPDTMGLFQGGPYNSHAGDDHDLMYFPQSRELYDDPTVTSGYYDYSSLHGKEQFSRKPKNNFSYLPSAQQSNFSSPRPSIYSNNQHLSQWQQLLPPGILRGKIVSLAKDQVGSGLLNLKLEDGLSEGEIEMILQEVIEFLGDLMRNQFGSHFVHKFFVGCNEVQRTRIIIALTEYPYKLISICLNSYGARTMQKLLEKLITPQQISLVATALSVGAIVLATDPSGHHVIQYFVKNFPGEYSKYIFNEIAENCFKIATNKSGCCVLPTCVENARGEARERLIREIIANVVHLAEDPYGNYVVQNLLGMRMQDVTEDLMRRLKGSFVSLSCNKYASNVVEKILLLSGEAHSTTVIMELLASSNASMLLVDPFGNFVIQTALSISKGGHIHEALLNLIQVNLPSMQSNLYGKKILAWFEKRKLHHA
ncbi:hypothetical protein DH2020_004019 [Rehmannia glutinosa]|uniref:PUM-HD domain-containing protein n=1 Tax=Rehmannia glutinosa TaxID=99300 RepID=A0ABR0XN85_REHGL